MKKFLKKVLFYSVCFSLLHGVFCIAADPYGVMHPLNIRSEMGLNKNYVKMSYILANPDKFDAFVFGSSRVGAIHVENMDGYRCYNMTMSNGLPWDHLSNIKTMIEAGIHPKKVFVGVDSISYTFDPALHFSSPHSMPYEYAKAHPIKFCTMYFNPAVVERGSVSIWKTALTQTLNGESNGDFKMRFYDCGWSYDYNLRTGADIYNGFTIGTEDRMEAALVEISEIVRLCSENHIELILFTNPMCQATYGASLDRDYLAFLRRLAEIAPYYNFSGYSDVACNADYWQDNSHYSAETGDLLIDVMCNGERFDELYMQGFGWYVTQDNIDDLLALPEINGGIMDKDAVKK